MSTIEDYFNTTNITPSDQNEAIKKLVLELDAVADYYIKNTHLKWSKYASSYADAFQNIDEKTTHKEIQTKTKLLFEKIHLSGIQLEKSLAKIILAINGTCYWLLPEHLKNDDDIKIATLHSKYKIDEDKDNLYKAKPWFDDDEFMAKAVNTNPLCFQHASIRLRGGYVLAKGMLKNINQSDKSAFNEICRRILNKDIILELLDTGKISLMEVDITLLSDEEIILSGIKRNYDDFNLAAPNIRNKKNVAIEAIKANNGNFRHLPNELKNDEDILIHTKEKPPLKKELGRFGDMKFEIDYETKLHQLIEMQIDGYYNNYEMVDACFQGKNTDGWEYIDHGILCNQEFIVTVLQRLKDSTNFDYCISKTYRVNTSFNFLLALIKSCGYLPSRITEAVTDFSMVLRVIEAIKNQNTPNSENDIEKLIRDFLTNYNIKKIYTSQDAFIEDYLYILFNEDDDGGNLAKKVKKLPLYDYYKIQQNIYSTIYFKEYDENVNLILHYMNSDDTDVAFSEEIQIKFANIFDYEFCLTDRLKFAEEISGLISEIKKSSTGKKRYKFLNEIEQQKYNSFLYDELNSEDRRAIATDLFKRRGGFEESEFLKLYNNDLDFAYGAINTSFTQYYEFLSNTHKNDHVLILHAINSIKIHNKETRDRLIKSIEDKKIRDSNAGVIEPEVNFDRLRLISNLGSEKSQLIKILTLLKNHIFNSNIELAKILLECMPERYQELNSKTTSNPEIAALIKKIKFELATDEGLQAKVEERMGELKKNSLLTRSIQAIFNFVILIIVAYLLYATFIWEKEVYAEKSASEEITKILPMLNSDKKNDALKQLEVLSDQGNPIASYYLATNIGILNESTSKHDSCFYYKIAAEDGVVESFAPFAYCAYTTNNENDFKKYISKAADHGDTAAKLMLESSINK